MKALALTVRDKKVFEVFSFSCHGNKSSSRNSNLWSFLKVHHPRIISVKFHWNLLAGFRGEDFLSNCSRADGRAARRTDAKQWSITIAHPENVVLRWAKKKSFENIVVKGENAGYHNLLYFPYIFSTFKKKLIYLSFGKICQNKPLEQFSPLKKLVHSYLEGN